MTRKTLTRMLPALVWALALVALGAAALFALGDASAQQPPISASIVDDTDINTNSLCGGHVWSDGHCDLRIRITDHSATDSQATIVASPIFSGAFDASVITPDDSALSSQTLGPTPTTYTIPGNTRQIFRLRMTPVVTASGSQYYEGYVRVHHGAGTNGRQLAEYKLTLQAPTPTSVTSESITSTSFAVRWKMDERARRTIIFWRPRDGGSPEQSVQVTMVQNAKYRIISGLQSSTCYVARVQPLLDGKSIESAEVEVATLADPDATDPPADPCAPLPPPPPCTIPGDYDVDDDGLIEVCSLQQLDAIRHDLDGDGVPDINPHPPNATSNFTWGTKTKHEYSESSSSNIFEPYYYARGDFSDSERKALYAAAYPNPETNMGCSEGARRTLGPLCRGYELSANLDFDENGNDKRDDTYNTGKGWRPIMGHTYIKPSYWRFGFFRPGFLRAWPNPVFGANDPFNRAKMFRTVFEGNGHTISNLYINRPNGLYVGLFGYVASSGTIRNLGLISPTIRGDRYVGSVAGQIERGAVTGSYAEGVDVSGRQYVGGLIAVLWGGNVLESYVTGRSGRGVDGLLSVGGLIGMANARNCGVAGKGCSLSDVELKYAFATVNTTGEGYFGVGGLIGYVVSSSYIQHTYATGVVTATGTYSGRLVSWGSLIGLRDGFPDAPVQVQQSYAIGRIAAHAGAATGGLIGKCLNQTSGPGWDSYWDVDTTGQSHSGCNRVRRSDGSIQSLGVTTVGGKTTSQLQTPTSASGIYSTWVTVDGVSIPVWDFGTSTQYPILTFCDEKPGIDLREGKTEYCPLREATQHGRKYSPSQ